MKSSPKTEFTDIASGRNYTLEEDTFNLIIFVDATTYRKNQQIDQCGHYFQRL